MGLEYFPNKNFSLVNIRSERGGDQEPLQEALLSGRMGTSVSLLRSMHLQSSSAGLTLEDAVKTRIGVQEGPLFARPDERV